MYLHDLTFPKGSKQTISQCIYTTLAKFCFGQNLTYKNRVVCPWLLKVMILMLRYLCCFFQIWKVATNETTTLHSTICTRIALENYNNTDHQFSKHDFQWQFLSLPKRQDRRVIIKGSKFEYALGISFIVTRYMFQL